VPGITEVLGIGGFVKQFQVNIDPDALLRYKVPLREVIARIEANNQNVGGHFLERNGEMFILRSQGLARDIRDLERIVITHEDGTPVYLEDVATVEVGGEIRQGLQTRNGREEVVSGMVVKLYGTKSSTVIEAVEAKLEEIEKALPEGVVIDPYYQQKTLVQASVDTVTSALLQGIGLGVLILLIFIGGFRPSIVVALAMFGSLIYALIDAPVYASLFMRRPHSRPNRSTPDSAEPDAEAGDGARENWLVRALVALYRPLVSLFVRFRVLAALLLGVGIAIFPRLGAEFTPRLLEGDIIANLTVAPSVSLEETKRNTLIAEQRLLEIPEIEQAAVGGVEVGQIYEGVQRYDIYVRYQQDARDTVEDIGQLIVQTSEGVLLPLGELASIEEVVGPR